MRSVEHEDETAVRDVLEAFEVLMPDSLEDQPDPVTLCQPSFDGDGLLRWASATFDVVH